MVMYRLKKYKVKILPKAREDMAEIMEYLNCLPPQPALGYYDLLTQKICGLCLVPQRYALIKDKQLGFGGYRCMPVDSYMVFYVILGDIVQVRRILFCKPQYNSLL